MRLPSLAAPPRHRIALLCWLLCCAGCGGDSNGGPGPTPQPPVVSTITPDAGTIEGNTLVTITGSNFAAGASVTIAGVPATAVSVASPSQLTARTGARNAGTGDVVVSVGGRIGTLANGFTYAVPGPSDNPSPVIKSLTARGSRKNEPAGFADLDETLTVTAAVADAETSLENLIFEWSAASGTISGSGPSVTWRAPAQAATPAEAVIEVVVIERYVTNDTTTPSVRENRAEQSTTVMVHDSIKEVGDMATRFLENFSVSSVPTSVVMQDFLKGCYGTAEEREQVEDNRRRYTITSWSVGPPTVTINFGGVCAFRSRRGDACSTSDVRWETVEIGSGDTGGVVGVDQVAAVYSSGRWWLCDSQFDGRSITTNRGFYESLTR